MTFIFYPYKNTDLYQKDRNICSLKHCPDFVYLSNNLLIYILFLFIYDNNI